MTNLIHHLEIKDMYNQMLFGASLVQMGVCHEDLRQIYDSSPPCSDQAGRLLAYVTICRVIGIAFILDSYVIFLIGKFHKYLNAIYILFYFAVDCNT